MRKAKLFSLFLVIVLITNIIPSASVFADGSGSTSTYFSDPAGKSGGACVVKVLSDGSYLTAGGVCDSVEYLHYDLTVIKYHSNGTIDTTFGTNGRVVIDTGTDYDNGIAIIVQSNGKIVVASGSLGSSTSGDKYTMMRLTSNGTLDTTFGSAGIVSTDIGETIKAPGGDPIATDDYVHAMVSDASGNIYLVGSVLFTGGGSHMNFAIAKYNSNGVLDSSYGTNGVSIIDFDGSGTGYHYCTSAAFDANGKLVVGGSAWISSIYYAAFVRLQADGSLDPAFGPSGSGGLYITNDIGLYPVVTCIGLQPGTNKLIAAGSYSDTAVSPFFVSLSSDGIIDKTFKTRLSAYSSSTDSPTGMAFDDQGNVYMTCNTTNADPDRNTVFGTLKVLSNLSALDTSFGTSGKTLYSFGPRQYDVSVGIAVDLANKVVLVGYSQMDDTRYDESLIRLTSTGSIDTLGGTILSFPIVTAVSPVSGSNTGGTNITITGSGFTGAAAVTFGETNTASFSVVSDTRIDAVAPAHSVGTVDIRVTTPIGRSMITAGDRLNYVLNSAPAASNVQVTGTVQYGQTLTGSYVYSDSDGNTESGSTYMWYRSDDASGLNKAAISGALSTTYLLQSADIGKYISFSVTPRAVTGTNPGLAVESGYSAVIQKADCTTATGITPVMSGKTDMAVTLENVTGYEYIRVANGASTATGTWQDSNVFSGLSSSTAYDFYQRVKETATHKASAVSAKLDVTTNAAALTGTAGISGTAVFGEILTASLTGTNNTGTLSYQWVRGGSDIPSANDSTYTLTEADIGRQISVRISSSVETGSISSTATAAVQKADCATVTGITPVLSGKTDTAVTLADVTGYEYTRVANGASAATGVWQDSNVFSGLSSSTAYDFYQRVKATATHNASAVSAKLDVTTSAAALTGTAGISGTAVYAEMLTASLSGTNNTGTLSYQWVRGGSDIPSANDSTYTLAEADIGQQISVRISSSVETGTITSAATASVQKADCATATGITPVLSGKTDTAVTLADVTGYEYTRVANGASSATGIWQDSNVFSGLSSSTAYDFYQRVKATATHNASAVSAKLDVTTSAAALTGTAGISGTASYGEILTASLSGTNNTGTLSYQWVRGGSDIPSANDSTYTLAEADIGQPIHVKISSSIETGTITSAATAAVQKADAAPAAAPAVASKTQNSITLSPVTGYEYIIVANGASSATGTWQDSNVFSGLSSSTEYDFYQRVKETATHNASDISDKLDVSTNGAALTGTAAISGTAAYGSILSASLTGTNNTGTLSYQWVRGGSDIPSATDSTYTLTAADIGQILLVKISSSVQTGTITSTATAAVQKAAAAAATAPVLTSKTQTSITLTPVAGYEYIVVANGAAAATGTWQDSSVFSGLSSSTAYDFYQRIKETTTHKASDISEKLDVMTDAVPTIVPSVTPTPSVTAAPTATPTSAPTTAPTATPTATPTAAPTTAPTAAPTATPTAAPTTAPTTTPAAAPKPTAAAPVKPASTPTATPAPTSTATETAAETTAVTGSQPASLGKLLITGTLLDADGKPMSGYLLELHSVSITAVTDAAGHFAFNDSSFTHHQLIVKKADGVQIAVFDLDFTEGGQFRSDVTQTGVDVTYTGKTVAINIELALTKDQNGVTISQVSGSEKLVNDTSGISSTGLLIWIAGGVLTIGIVIFFYFFLIKKKNKKTNRRY